MRKVSVRRAFWLALMLAICMFLPLQVSAKSAPKTTVQLSSVEQILAPIALYPDSLLGNVLIASTYPKQILAAQDLLDKYPKATLEEVAKKAEAQDLDESVVSLLATPDVLYNMSSDMDWTYDLADVFTNKNDEMYTAIQKLRKVAYDNKKLVSNDEVKVSSENNYIYINPTNPNTITVPSYDVNSVYGLSTPNYGYTFINSAIQWGTYALLNEVFYGSSWDWSGRRFWWGPGYNYYRYWNNSWYPWNYNPNYYNPPPPPPPSRPSYNPPPPRPRPPRDEWDNNRRPPRPDHHWNNNHRPDRPDWDNNHKPGRPDRPGMDKPSRPVRPDIEKDRRPGRPGRPDFDRNNNGRRPGSTVFDNKTRPVRPDFDRNNNNRPGRPTFDSDKANRRPDRPSYNRPTSERPSFNQSRPSQPSRPSFNQSRPSQPSRPSFNQSRPSQPSRPSFNQSRPSQPSRPSFNQSRPSQPSRPSMGSSRPSRPSGDRPEGGRRGRRDR